MRLRLLVLAIMLFSGPVLAQDEPVPGGQSNLDLMKICQSETVRLYCLGYIFGMDDMHSMMSAVTGRRLFCIPEAGITGEQSVRIFVKWAEDHTERLHESRRLGVIEAFSQAFPCN